MADTDPKELKRIQDNVAKMRAQGATDAEVVEYLKIEDAKQPVDHDTDINFRNVGRAITQGATYGFGDELGLTDRGKAKAFKRDHAIVDFIAKLAGGAVAPVVAATAVPALATAGGAAALGAGVGALSGVGEGETAKERMVGGAAGGVLGAAGGYAGAKLAQGMGIAAKHVMDVREPARAVARGANNLLTPEVTQRMSDVNALAPGGTSIASAAVPKDGLDETRFLDAIRGLGANPKAAAQAEVDVLGQRAALKTKLTDLGAQMDVLDQQAPVTNDLWIAQKLVKNVLGPKHTPQLGPRSVTTDLQSWRNALSLLREDLRSLASKPPSTGSGVRMSELRSAHDALRDALYAMEPRYAALDQPYAVLSEEMRNTQPILETIQRSRHSHTGNDMYMTSSGSLGGKLPQGKQGAATFLSRLFLPGTKAKAADAVATYITQPGGPDMIAQLLKNLPKTHPMRAQILAGLRTGMTASGFPATQGLLFPAGEQ